MKNFNKKVINIILLVILITMFMTTIVNAGSVVRRGNKIVNTTIYEEEEKNTTVYVGEIKKDGVTVLRYLYSNDITRSSVVFDNLRECLPVNFSNLVPNIIGEQTPDKGMKELSITQLNGIDLTSILDDWRNAKNIASQIYEGTITDEINSNMYDIDSDFKTILDEKNEKRENEIENHIISNKRIISHLGTRTNDTVSFKVENGTLVEVHDVKLTYLSEATTVIYNSVNTNTTINEEQKLGDVNKDGRINAQDATLILKYLAKKVDLTDEQLALADTDRDGRVKASDAVRILKYVAKKISEI